MAVPLKVTWSSTTKFPLMEAPFAGSVFVVAPVFKLRLP